jgi:hypothetical protein
MNPTAERAKEFLVDRILNEADRGDVPLADIEVAMLGFSEAAASREEIEAAAEFERDYNEEQYEIKIAKLVRGAYQRDKRNGKGALWDHLVDALAEEDMYLSVILDKAGIQSAAPFSFLLRWKFIRALVPSFALVVAGILLAFTPFGEKIIPSGILRIVLLLCCLIAPLLIAKLSSHVD